MNQEESEQNEFDGMKKGADSTGKVMHMCLDIQSYDMIWPTFEFHKVGPMPVSPFSCEMD